MNDIGMKKQIFNHSENRSGGAISPVFGFIMLLFAWFGTFAIMSINENPDPNARFVLPTIVTLMILIPGLYLFQSYKLDVNTDYVTWETSIIPSIWSESWKEPITSYCEILILKTKPELGFRLKYNPARIAYPKKVTGKYVSESDKAFNKKPHAIIVLRHRSDSKKNVSLKYFVWDQPNMWNASANQISKDLNLPITVSNQ